MEEVVCLLVLREVCGHGEDGVQNARRLKQQNPVRRCFRCDLRDCGHDLGGPSYHLFCRACLCRLHVDRLFDSAFAAKRTFQRGRDARLPRQSL